MSMFFHWRSFRQRPRANIRIRRRLSKAGGALVAPRSRRGAFAFIPAITVYRLPSRLPPRAAPLPPPPAMLIIDGRQATARPEVRKHGCPCITEDLCQ